MPQPSPLEKRLKDMGPIRGDGSDKFFGMENVRLSPHSAVFAQAADGLMTARLTLLLHALIVRKHLLLQFDSTMSLLLRSLS